MGSVVNFIPKDYQAAGRVKLIRQKKTALWLRPGRGKTPTTLSALQHLRAGGDIDRVLVIGTLRIVNSVWPGENRKFGFDFDMAVATGTPKQRAAALAKNAFVTCINGENLHWLVEQCGAIYDTEKNRWKKDQNFHWPWDCVVIDESSKFKDRTTKRWRAMRVVMPYVDRLIQLTGSPAANSIADVYAPIFLLDSGERLGRTVTAFRDRWFQMGFDGFTYKPLPHANREIRDAVSDIVFAMDADHAGLPPLTIVDDTVQMSDADAATYKKFVRTLVAELPDEKLTAKSALALSGKLGQFANGAIYRPDKSVAEIHSAKLDALVEYVEELSGDPVIIAYQYRHDIARIQARIKHALLLDSNPRTIDRWNAGEIPVLLLHAASAGHGLNMQFGGANLAWFGLPWSLELYEQTIARLWRDGQKHEVLVRRFLTEGTIDRVTADVLASKDASQQALFDALSWDLQRMAA